MLLQIGGPPGIDLSLSGFASCVVVAVLAPHLLLAIIAVAQILLRPEVTGRPRWIAMVIALPYFGPCIWFWIGSERYPSPEGGCDKCHYSRRGLNPSAPCPECGLVP